MQLSFDDLWHEPEEVFRAEQGAKSGRQLKEQAEAFYRKNPELLKAHVKAAQVFQDAGVAVSARSLTEFVRRFQVLGYQGVMELADIYSQVDWERDEPYAISNDTSSWLTRFLEGAGFEVTKTRAKQDSIKEE